MVAKIEELRIIKSCLTPWDGQAVRVFNPYSDEAAPTINAAAAETGTPSKTIIDGESGVWVVRRLTPKECERLQGFPDGWTEIEGATDTARYKALGNSMAVPVMRWIGERIEEVENDRDA